MVQRLTLTLDGITAGDYLAWARHPEPPGLGRELTAIELRADPLGDAVEAWLTWTINPPAPHEAARGAGLPLTPEVVHVEARALAVAA
ncbi:MAG: hypothetical protein ACXVFM_17175 [Solirubrobacteraceae bacterium]